MLHMRSYMYRKRPQWFTHSSSDIDVTASCHHYTGQLQVTVRTGTHERCPALPGASMETGSERDEQEREMKVAFLTGLM